MTKQDQAAEADGTPAEEAIDEGDYFERTLAVLRRFQRLVEAHSQDMEAGNVPATLRELGELSKMSSAVLKEEGRLREQDRARRVAEGRDGLDLDLARTEIERRMARLRADPDAGEIPDDAGT